jgi:hypothetical protein
MNVKYLRALNKVKFGHHAKTIMYPEFMPFDEPSTIGVAAEVVCQECCAVSEKTFDAEVGRDVCPGWKACQADITAQTAKWASEATCGDQVKWRLREMIFDGVTLHEMGHNHGLRHNFKGSYDAMNYFDPYWEIRKMDGTVRSRTSDPATEEELAAKITEYQYSSIMDYGAKFNSDFQGLGRHDYASIMHAYAGFTQVFNQVNDDELISVMQTSRTFSYPVPIRLYYEPRGPEATQYTRIHYDPALADTADNAVDTSESNRDFVPRAWITEQPLAAGGDLVFRTESLVEGKAGTSQSRVMVPYKMCSDEFRNTSLGCNYFDEGADLYEITENQIQAYENYYIFNNFGRDRYEWGWDETQYTGRILSRYFDLMQNHAQYWVLWYTIFHDLGIYSPTTVDNFMANEDLGLGTFTTGVARSFETFARVLNNPAAGYYTQVDRMDGTSHWWMDSELQYPPQSCNGADCFMLDYTSGKYWDDTWDFDFGYQWYLRKIRYGQFYDRNLAIQMLGEATNNFMGRDTQDDVRKYTINYARIWPEHIKALFSAIGAQNLTQFSPSYCGQDGQGNAILEHRDILNLHKPRCSYTGGTFQGYVNPGDTFTSQLSATTWGLAMFPMNYYQDFLDYSRIYVLGNGEGIDWSNIPAGASLVEFTDPFSYKTYQAVRYPQANLTGDPVLAPTYAVSPSIGADMLQQALDIQASYEFWLNEYNTTPTTENYDNMYRYRENLRSYIINLDVTRATSYLFEHPDYTVVDED